MTIWEKSKKYPSYCYDSVRNYGLHMKKNTLRKRIRISDSSKEPRGLGGGLGLTWESNSRRT